MSLETLSPDCSVQDIARAMARDNDILPPECAVGRWPQELPVLVETGAVAEEAA